MGEGKKWSWELDIARKRIEALPATPPEEVVKALNRKYDSISLELNYLYDDQSLDEISKYW